MGRILEAYGVTRQLLESNSLKSIVSGKATANEIGKVISALAPRGAKAPLIRVGPDRDGGYLIPDDLEGIAACFSPGTANRKDFEDQLAEDYRIKSFLLDYTSEVSSFETPILEGMQFFEKKWLDLKGKEHSIDINSWIEQNSSPGDELILQMDIEGAEYRNLLDLSEENLRRFRIIVLEVHGLHLLRSKEFIEVIFDPVMQKILAHFHCVHMHPNNCCGSEYFSDSVIVPRVLELTFHRKDRCKTNESKVNLPNALDVINIPQNRPLHLLASLRRNATEGMVEDAELRIQTLEARIESLERRFNQTERRVNRLVAPLLKLKEIVKR